MTDLSLREQTGSVRLQQLLIDIRNKPERASVYKQTARMLAAQNQHRQASRVLKIGLKHLPDDLGLLENLARTLQAGGNPRAAVRTWHLLRRKFPENFLAYEKLERHYVRSGQFKKAVHLYRRVREQEPLKEKSLERIVFVCKEANDVPGTLQALKKLVKSFGPTFQRSRDLGRFYFKADRFKEASHWLEKAFWLGEGDLDLRLTLALSYSRQKKFAQAEEHLQKILREKPNSFAGLINLCELKIEEGRLGQSETILRKIDSLYPNNSRALLCRGELSLKTGKHDEAEKALRTGIRKTPYYFRWELERGYRLLSRILRCRGIGSEADLCLTLAEALHLAPDAYQAFITLAEEKIRHKDLDPAAQVLKLLNRMFPGNTRVVIARAEIELLKGYPLKAIEMLIQNLEKTPVKFMGEKIRGYRVLGRAYRNLGDWKGAWQSFRQAKNIESSLA